MNSSPGRRRSKKFKRIQQRGLENLSKQEKSSQKSLGEIPSPRSRSKSEATTVEKDKVLVHEDAEIEVVNLDSSDEEVEEVGEKSRPESSKNPGEESDNLFDSLEENGDVNFDGDGTEEKENVADSDNIVDSDSSDENDLFDSLDEKEEGTKLDDLSAEGENDDESGESTEMDIASVSESEEEEDITEMNELLDSNDESDAELNDLSDSNENAVSPSFSRDFSSDQSELEMEEETGEEEAIAEEPPTPIPFMRNLQEGIFYRKMDCNSIFVSIIPGQSLYFSGKCSVKVLKGVVEIYGCQLTSEEPKRIVFSPKGHSSLLAITSLASESEMDRDLTTTRNTPIPIVEGEAAMIILELVENEWCEGIRNYCHDGQSLVGPPATGIGPGKLPQLDEFSRKLGFQLVSPSQYNKSRLFSTSPVWDEVLYSLQMDDNSPRIAIFGGKGVGKSTFFRWTVNKCLSLYGQSVLCIDLDPGQAEFTPPGLVSMYLCQEPLLGPNFTHLVQPLKAVFIGSISVNDCPTSYKNAVKSLYDFVRENEEYSRIPWIINTMGFSVGLGVHLACDIIKTFQPTSVIQITIENPKRSFPFELTCKNVHEYENRNRIGKRGPSHLQSDRDNEAMKEYQFYTIESVCNAKNERNQNPWGGRPKDLRENVIASYFAGLIGSTTDCNFLSIIPYQVKLEETAIGTMSSNLSYDNILRAINGNLVALCEFPQDSFSSYSPNSENTSKSSRVRKYILNGSSVMNSCFGYGVVRGMDVQSGLLFVVTPVPSEILTERVNTIISAGAIGLPITFYLNGANENSELPYISGRGSSKTKLDGAAKKHFNYKRTIPKCVKNSLR